MLKRRIYRAQLVNNELTAGSPTLRAVLDMAKQDEAEAICQIALADPTDHDNLMRLQFQLRLYMAIPAYVSELLEAGRTAEQASEDGTPD